MTAARKKSRWAKRRGWYTASCPKALYLLLASDLSAEGVADGRTLGLVYETDIKAKARRNSLAGEPHVSRPLRKAEFMKGRKQDV